ncbi:MAG TPA: hypothetical protein PK052_11870 [Anaerohalosphaeraceae bacterium]|nr:hypothetical protein [Anaerohalosphaeraceae bacterium]
MVSFAVATNGKKTVLSWNLFTIVLAFLVLTCFAHADIFLNINGDDPAAWPVELSSPQSLEIRLLDSEPNNTSYDLTLTAIGGEFSHEGSSSSTLVIQTSDLESIGSIAFQLVDDPGLAVVSLTTNQPLAIATVFVPADTEVYQLIVFDMQEDNKVVVFGVNYQSFSYISVEEEPTEQLFQMESLEKMEVDGGSTMMSMSGETELLAWDAELLGPLGSCIIEPGTYRISSLPLQIEGHVVIPAGVRLIAPYDPNSIVIEVMPGGLLETGKAAFYSEEDYPNVLPPVEIIPEDPNHYWFWHNSTGIYVHRGADSKTRIENLEIAGCMAGIVIDEALIHPVRYVITIACYDGIHLYAPVGIVDCEFWYNGSVWYWMDEYILAHFGEYMNGTLFEDENISAYASAAVYVHLDGEAFPYPEISIERVVMDSADVGLYVRGINIDPNLPDPNVVAPLVPQISVTNSTFSLTYFYGLYKTDTEATINVQYSAFAANSYYNTNVYISYIGYFVIPYDPFYLLESSNRLYIDPWSHLINAGYGIATDGTGVCHDWPDTGQMDIGCHFALGLTGGFGIPSSSADFNRDGIVDAYDLVLMEMCMGARSDPNIVRMDLDYDSWVNLGDFAFYACDYGWASDPNLSLHADPNCARSDFNNNGFVNFADLEVLAEYWLTPVFDEYRICSLCNLHTGTDPNDPNAPSGADLIDQRDMDAFMLDWEKTYAPDPDIVIEHSASMLSVAVENPVPAWRISAFLDDEPIGQWDNWELETPVFDLDMMRFGPGSHRLKIVRSIDYGLEITERIIADPNSVGLYFADIPEYGDPNQTYEVSAYNPMNNQYSITFTDDLTGLIVDTVTASDEVMYVSVPGSFLANGFASVTIKNVSSDKEIDRQIKKPFDPNDWAIRPRAVICPDTHWWNGKDLFVQRRPAILAAAQAFENQGIAYCVLYKKDVTPANLQFVLGNRSLRYVYWVGHGNRSVGDPEIPRTSVNCWVNGKKVPAFSFTRNTISNAPALLTAAGNNYDHIGFDLNSITIDGRPMREAGTKRLVVVDTCSSCVTHNLVNGEYDLAWVFGAYTYNPGWPLDEHMNYIGWARDVAAGGGTIFNDDTTDRMVDFWNVLGSGNNLALAYERIWNNSATASASASLLPTFFGDDELNQYGKEDDTFKREGLAPKEQKIENR